MLGEVEGEGGEVGDDVGGGKVEGIGILTGEAVAGVEWVGGWVGGWGVGGIEEEKTV